jgi:hypothetical protein
LRVSVTSYQSCSGEGAMGAYTMKPPFTKTPGEIYCSMIEHN